MARVLLTGGGSAGHVSVNLALIPRFLQEGWTVEYIGSEHGIERQLISAIDDVTYTAIDTGKFRRYFSWQNVKDPFKVVKGAYQAYRFIRRSKPDVLFSKGGFVSVPVVLGAWLNRVPVIIHESDMSPGLANKLCMPLATRICTTFRETEDLLNNRKTEYVGAVIRDEIRVGRADRGRRLCGFGEDKPVLLVMGGSLGSQKINQVVRAALPELTKSYCIVHLCGKGQQDASISIRDYKQFEYVDRELANLLAMSDIIVSRAGSNAIFEFLSLHKPMLLIPLTRSQSRGDQIANAESFAKSGFGQVLYEGKLSADTLVRQVAGLYRDRQAYIGKMKAFRQQDTLSALFHLIKSFAPSRA